MPQGGLPYAGTPEMDQLVAQINKNPAMMGQIAQSPELRPLLAEVLKHMGVDADDMDEVKQLMETEDGEDAEVTQAALPPNEEATSDYSPPASEAEEEEEEAPATGSEPVEAPDESAPDVMEANAMPRQLMRQPVADAGRSDPMDELISAQMMERSVGNPNAPVPAGANVGRMQRPALKQSPRSVGVTPQQAMIQQLVRQAQQQGSNRGRKRNA